MQQYILGVDIGTGSTKAIALDLEGNVLSKTQQYYDIYNPEQGYSEQDPEAIWQAFIKCIQQIRAKLKIDPVIISLSSVMHSVICVDKSGNALTNMITWADVRSERIAIELKKSAEGEKIYRQTGTPIHPMSPLCKLIWLSENKAKLFKETYKFISIKEYLWFNLFNEYQIDYSVASGTGLFDIIKLNWSDDACSLAGITADQLSEAVNTNYIRSDIDPAVAELMGIATNTLFIIGASDGCCANLGSHVTERGTVALTIGTSGAVRVTGLKPIYNYDAMVFNYLLDEKTFVSGGATNNGGNAVDWLLRKFLNKINVTGVDYDELFKAIETIPSGSNGLIFLPYLYGERAPIWDAKSSGAYLNIRPEHTQDHFLRAGIEGICFALNDVLTRLEESSEVKTTRITISGGFITSAIWVQLLADITGKELVVYKQEDASAVGAIYIALNALYPDNSQFKTDIDSSVIHPDKQNHEHYAKTFIVYKKVYNSLKDSITDLYSLN